MCIMSNIKVFAMTFGWMDGQQPEAAGWLAGQTNTADYIDPYATHLN